MKVYGESKITNTPVLHPARRAIFYNRALSYAERDWRVFPLQSVNREGYCTCGKPECRIVTNKRTPAGKHPRIGEWPSKATIDPRQIAEWQYLWPDSNLAILTGRKSGIFVLDIDSDKGGFESLEELEDKYSELPSDYIVQTGRGGMQFYFLYPDDGTVVKSGADVLGPGIDVRGDGGYVVAPPGVTQDEYRLMSPVENDLASPPEWLLERLRKAHRAAKKTSEGDGRADSIRAGLDGPKIKAGARNNTLAKIAGKLHDGRSPEELKEALLEVNTARCDPPLPSGEVLKIAASAARYPIARKSYPEVSEEALSALDIMEVQMWNEPERWKGKAGQSQYKIKYALINEFRRYGTMVDIGIRGSISHRKLAELSGCSRETVTRNIKRMRQAGELRTDNMNRKPDKAGSIILTFQGSQNNRANHHHSNQFKKHVPADSCMVTIRADSVELSKLRHAAPGHYRLGPQAARVVMALLRSETSGHSNLEDLADALGVSRPRDLRRKNGIIERMINANIVSLSPNGKDISLSIDWRDKLDIAREAGGEYYAESVQRHKHALERERWYQSRGKA